MKTAVFDLESMKKLRADFLKLMKNAEKVRDYRQAEEFAAAVERFKVYVERVVILGMLPVLNVYGKSAETVRLENVVGTFLDRLKVPFFPMGSEWQKAYAPGADEAAMYARYTHQAGEWAWAVKEQAKAAWKVLEGALATRRGGPSVAFRDPEEETVELAGFTVRVARYDETKDFHRDAMERLKAGLRDYRARAQHVLPILVKKQVPLVLRFDVTNDLGGQYLGDHIDIYPLSARSVGRVAHFLAHEMGHHLFQTVLSGAARTFWDTAVRGDYGPVDLRDLLTAIPAGEDLGTFLFNRSLALKNPALYLQGGAVFFPEGDEPWRNKAAVERYVADELAAGRAPVVSVPKNPITVYATKNTEEAFCEAVGMLVGYGPRAVPEVVRNWLKIILPEVKLESKGELRGLVEELRGLVS